MLCAEKLDEGLGSSGFSSKCCEIETKVIFWLIKTGEAKQSKYSTSSQRENAYKSNLSYNTPTNQNK